MKNLQNNWRTLTTKNLSAKDNMDLDLFLLNEFIEKDLTPILRFYSWEKPTISLGRSQNLDEIDIEYCKKNNIDIVKRQTGGKAVFHQGEFTYSFIASKKFGLSDNIFDSYKQISEAIIFSLNKLKKLDLFIGNETKKYFTSSFCFATSSVSDINFGGKKFIGSAQLRKGSNLLQHGSIIINQDFSLLKNIFKGHINIEEQINLSEILGFIPTFEELEHVLLAGFSEFFEVYFEKIIYTYS
ncbi:MAG: lipoate--protein ligase family protein [Candidatus Sericytochromatia bacterium]